jgi:tetratricopeptide (TPR) repeat protein
MNYRNLTGLSCYILAACTAFASPLDNQIKAFEASQTQTEGSVVGILSTGIKEHRTAEAFAKVKPWLTANPSNSQKLLFQAGQAADFAGKWPEAVSFYRKLLKGNSLDARIGGVAVDSVYRLLINSMNEPESAYLLMREDGDRLRSYGRAKQYDSWYMEQALKRTDLIAIANRLSAVYNTSDPVEHLAKFEVAMLSALETYEYSDKETLAALDNLAKAKRSSKQLRARLNWVKAIIPAQQRLEQSIVDRKEIAASLLGAPLRAAEELIAVLPYEGSIIVSEGWMHSRQGDSGVFSLFVKTRRAERAAPILKALRSMSTEQAQRVLGHKVNYARDRKLSDYLFSRAESRKLVRDLPAVFNSLSAPDVALFDKTLTVEDAKAMAPNLARNPHAQAAMVRAWAKPERKYSLAVDEMMKTDAWRFSEIKTLTHGLWHSGMFERDIKYEVPLKKYAKLDGRYQKLKSQINKKANSKDRLAAFNTLRTDLLSASPKIAGSLPLWDELFTQSPDADNVVMIKSMTSDFKGGREALLHRALGKAGFGKKRGGRLPWQAVVHDNHFRYHQKDTRKGGEAILTQLPGLLKAQLKSGTLSETIFGMWLHSVVPSDDDAKTLMQEIARSSAYAKIDPAYHKAAADRYHFGTIGMTLTMAANDPQFISRELMALPKEPTPAQVTAAVKVAVDRASKATSKVSVIGLLKVAALPEWTAPTRSLVLSLFKENAPLGAYPSGQGYESLVVRIAKEAQENQQWGELEPYAAGLWHAAASKDSAQSNGAIQLSLMTEAAFKADSASIAATFSRAAVHGSFGRIHFPRTDNNVPLITARIRGVIGRAAVAIGAVEIPVDETDPAFGIYKSNSEYIQGNLESSWELYEANADKLEPIIRKLAVEYNFWLLKRNTEMNYTDRAETLVKELMIWSRQSVGTFSPAQEAELKIAYANLAFRKGALPTSRAWYRKVADAAEYKGTSVQVRAALGSVMVDRVSKDFSSALSELDKLMTLKDPDFRIQVYYARGEVFMDQENYKEAFDAIDYVLRQQPKHADALILRGKIQFKMRKLVEASEIELGPSQDDTVIVPGEAIKINLRDPTLSVSGVGADIEVEIWAESGDSERVMLNQLGDSKEKFRAEIPTALGAPIKGDKILQILGKDKIRFGYSKRFRSKMDDLPADPKLAIEVASDAQLAFSAGAFPPREGERRLSIEELGLSTAQAALGIRSVRPGNPVYIRVSDPDQSLTPGIDEVTVNLSVTSGDVIRQLVLKETGPYTGEFQGVVPTAGAQAMAFASESAPGRDPNMAISSNVYPGWSGNVGDKDKARTFGVDLNDNVSLDKMSFNFGAAGQGLTHFVLQTSMNGSKWSTRARFPAAKDAVPWNGRPRISSFPTYRGGMAISEPEGRQLPKDWSEIMELTSARASINYLAAEVSGLSAEKLPIVNTGHPNYGGLIQYRALFYQPAAAIRRFRLTGYPIEDAKGKIQTIFLIDGQPASEKSDDPLTIEREFGPGLHEIQIWYTEGASDFGKRKPVLLCDVPGKDTLLPCPDSMFDPAQFPEGARQLIDQPATITETDTGIDVVFGDRTQARLVRLVIQGFEGVSPTMKSVSLSDRNGKALLPVAQDYKALRENLQLEVLPGDRVNVRYEDPRSATPKRTRHDKNLTVAFNTATLTASFLNYKQTDEGRIFEPEAIRRFKFDDAVALVIDDADMDSGPQRDTLNIQVTTSDGKKVIIKAVETEVHSGRFIGRVFPVSSKPERDSEIQLPEGGTITATYRDMENLDPGIPTDRTVTIEHAKYGSPSVAAYNITSKLLPVSPIPDDETITSANEGSKRKRDLGPEVVEPSRALNYNYIDEPSLAKTSLKGVIGSSLLFDVVVPHLALARSSEIRAYIQTDAARKAAKVPSGKVFDVSVPGTLKLTGALIGTETQIPTGYTAGTNTRPKTNATPLEQGRFSFSVPLILGDPPIRSFATKAAEAMSASALPDGLAVRAGDIVHVGYPYKDADDKVQWKTMSYTVGSHAFLSVMNGNFNRTLRSAFVGEKVYIRLLARGLDQTPERDTASVILKGSSGVSAVYKIRETEHHSGIFKGVFTISYADDEIPAKLPPVELNGFPIRYGDNIDVSYAASGEDPLQELTVSINNGADGVIEPFSKRYSGNEMAVKTSFTLAECFFELAKKHRKMDQESLARREMGQARKLLLEALATHRDDEMRAHAEYLLGNLAQEYADLSKNAEAKLPLYQDALARFSKIPTDYPETVFAAKAQFKTALVYEKMGEIENSVEEYVKLAYKYPDDELIPTVMSRLGGYFKKKGMTYKKQADLLREKEEVESKAEVLRLDELSYPEFLKAAMVYSKLQERFPDNLLAGLAGLSAAQNYMRAHQYKQAIDGFQIVINNEQYDDRDIRAQALYWCGLSHERIPGGGWKSRGQAQLAAYQIYRRVTFDFPDSKWAKYSRGRLADPVFARIIEQEAEGREKMLEALKEANK